MPDTDFSSVMGVGPKHERLKRYLMAQLAEGRFKPGQALPTEVQLAESLSISRTTVRQAFAELERHGVIRRIRGKGTFINESVGSLGSDGRHRHTRAQSLYGLVLPEIHHGFYPVLQRSFTEAAGQLRRQVIVSNSDQDPLRQADILLQLADQKVGGIAIVPTSSGGVSSSAHHIRPLQALGIPVVLCHRGVEGARAPLVTYSGLDVGRMAGRVLVEHGHRQVAFFATHRSTMADFYLQGFREVMSQAGAPLDDRYVYIGVRVGHAITAEHEAGVRAKLRELFSGKAKPTAIFTTFDSEAEFIFLLLTEMGLRVPQDVSLVGVGGAWRVGPIVQQLTSVTVDEGELGRRAVNFLDEMGRGKRAIDDGEVSTVSLRISEGKTLAKVRG